MFYLTLGMIIFWAVTFVFVFSVMRRQRRLEAEVEALREVLREE